MKSKKQCEKEKIVLEEKNQNNKFRVSFCRKAKEFTVQVKEPNNKWLCLHD